MTDQALFNSLEDAIFDYIKKTTSTYSIPMDELRSSIGIIETDKIIARELINKTVQIPTKEGKKVCPIFNSIIVEDEMIKFEISKEVEVYLLSKRE